MLNQIPAPDHVIAMSMSGTITTDDVDQAYAMTTEKLAGDGKVNFYGELIGEFGVEAKAVLRDLALAPEVLGKLRRFDRIAFVTNHGWMRAIARVEGALLSLADIELHVYDESDRDHALAWAEGLIDEDAEHGLREIETTDPHIAAFEVRGKLHKADMETAKALLGKFQDEREPRRLLGRFKDFNGFDLSFLADRELLKMKLESVRHVDRYALVGAPEWLGALAESISKLMTVEVERFDADDEAAAWEWLKEPVPA